MLLNQGSGTFTPAVSYGLSNEPRSVAVADMNLDGMPDLVVAELDSNVAVLLNKGNGLFEASLLYSAGYGSTSIAAADLNADGRADLVVANGGVGTMSVLLNTCLP